MEKKKFPFWVTFPLWTKWSENTSHPLRMPRVYIPLFHDYLIMQWFIKFSFSQRGRKKEIIMKSTLKISSTKGQDLESYIAVFLPCCPVSLAFWMLFRNHSPVRMKNFQDVLMEHWNVLSLPLLAGIFLCLLMGFTTEKVLLKSEDHFRNALALKTHEVTLRSLCKVDNGNNLDCVLAQALAGSNSPEAVHQIVSGPSVKPRIWPPLCYHQETAACENTDRGWVNRKGTVETWGSQASLRSAEGSYDLKGSSLVLTHAQMPFSLLPEIIKEHNNEWSFESEENYSWSWRFSNNFLQIWKYIRGSLLVIQTDNKETKMEVKAKIPKEPQNGPSSVCKHRA